MKTIQLNLQSKGGSGKSMLTYLQALKHEDKANVCFIDLDSSTKTSVKQLKFISEKSTERMLEIDIFDSFKKIDREKIFQIFEDISKRNFDMFFVDFGAPESEQFPNLFSFDFTVPEFLEFEKELNVKLVFNIILAGGTAYESSFDYLKKITNILKGKFELVVYINDYTFKYYDRSIPEVKVWAKSTNGWVKDVRQFGDIHIDRSSGQIITDNIKEGRGMVAYASFASRTIIKRELAKL